MSIPRLSKHAQHRWDQRFLSLDLESEWEGAKKAGRSRRKKIQMQCPAHSIKGDNGHTYWLSKNDVVFVCSADGLVVTVFPLINQSDRNFAKKRKGAVK